MTAGLSRLSTGTSLSAASDHTEGQGLGAFNTGFSGSFGSIWDSPSNWGLGPACAQWGMWVDGQWDPLDSAGNSVLRDNLRGKGIGKRMDVRMCTTGPLWGTEEINTINQLKLSEMFKQEKKKKRAQQHFMSSLQDFMGSLVNKLCLGILNLLSWGALSGRLHIRSFSKPLSTPKKIWLWSLHNLGMWHRCGSVEGTPPAFYRTVSTPATPFLETLLAPSLASTWLSNDSVSLFK